MDYKNEVVMTWGLRSENVGLQVLHSANVPIFTFLLIRFSFTIVYRLATIYQLQ